MRSHGVPDCPDPTSNGSAAAIGAVDKRSPAFQTAEHAWWPILDIRGTAQPVDPLPLRPVARRCETRIARPAASADQPPADAVVVWEV
jgi:hypothetical protein